MINDHGAKSNDPHESPAAFDDGREVYIDRERSTVVLQDPEGCQASGWLHGGGPGGTLFPPGCTIDLQVVEGVHFRLGSGILIELDSSLRVRLEEDGKDNVYKSR